MPGRRGGWRRAGWRGAASRRDGRGPILPSIARQCPGGVVLLRLRNIYGKPPHAANGALRGNSTCERAGGAREGGRWDGRAMVADTAVRDAAMGCATDGALIAWRGVVPAAWAGRRRMRGAHVLRARAGRRRRDGISGMDWVGVDGANTGVGGAGMPGNVPACMRRMICSRRAKMRAKKNRIAASHPANSRPCAAVASASAARRSLASSPAKAGAKEGGGAFMRTLCLVSSRDAREIFLTERGSRAALIPSRVSPGLRGCGRRRRGRRRVRR